MGLKFTDYEIINGLLNRHAKTCNDIIEYLYHTERKKISSLVIRNNGSLSDAEDLFQNVILDFVESVWQHKFILKNETKISTYIYAVAYNQWKKHLNREGKKIKWESNFTVEFASGHERSPFELLIHNEELLTYSAIFNKIGEKCREILLAFYNENMSINEITLAFGFSSENATKVRKFRCMKELSTVLHQQK